MIFLISICVIVVLGFTETAKISRDLQKNPELTRHVQNYTEISRDLQKNPELTRHVQNYTEISRDLPKNPELTRHVQNYTEISRYIQNYAEISRNTQNYAELSRIMPKSLEKTRNELDDSYMSLKKDQNSTYLSSPLGSTSFKPCSVNNIPGVCMFTWDCITLGGTPVGVCRAGLGFGSCCSSQPLSPISAMTKVKMDERGIFKPVQYGTHDCGKRSPNLFTRKGHVYNGGDAKFGEFPWHVSLRRVSTTPKTIPWCGGSLLNHQWILTAAHCFHRVSPANIVARLGEFDFKKQNEAFPYVERRVRDNIPHPKYYLQWDEMNNYDISLLRMESPIRFQPHIAPICLTGSPEDLQPGDELVVAGWGLTENLRRPSVLQKVVLPVIGNSECEELYYNEGYTLVLSNKLFCAGFDKGEVDTCQGDSGGALHKRGKDGRFYVVGIVSTGIDCAKPNFPGLNLRVFPFLDWIFEIMAKHRE